MIFINYYIYRQVSGKINIEHNEMKIGVFISFGWEDHKLMNLMKLVLEESEVLKPIVITDKQRDNALQLITEKVANGIVESKYFIPILTRKSYKNQWVNQEIGYATAKKKLVYPVIEELLLKIRKLKGWIHSEKDLPYKFEISDDEKNCQESFKNAFQPLIQLLERESQPIVFSQLAPNEKLKYSRGGEIIFVHDSSRHLFYKGFIYPIQNERVYNLIKSQNGLKERRVTPEEFNSYPIERLIK